MLANASAPSGASQKVLDADTALHTAWMVWLTMLAIPFLLFIVVLWTVMDAEKFAGDSTFSRSWFIGTMAYLCIGVPAAFFWRGRMFRGYWRGENVAPREYLLGMITIWSAFEIGGLLGLTGCLLTHTLLPNLLPAMVAFMLFTPLWPNGHSMTRPLQDEHDPADYEDPR